MNAPQDLPQQPVPMFSPKHFPVYMDYSATTPIDPRVVDKMLPYLREQFGNAASRSHAYGWAAEEAVEWARSEVAQLVHADPREIVFTSGATESINLALKGAAHFYKDRGNHIITVKTEHKATLDTCRELEREGYEVTYLDVLPNGNYLVRAYRTDDTGIGSKGFGQRGEGLYLSLTNPYPGRNVNTVEFEISPSDIVTYKEEFKKTIPYERLTSGSGNFQDRVKLIGGKAFIGGINSSEDPNLEIVLYDKNLINRANESKKKVSNFTTEYKLYNLPTEKEKQQAQQLYSQYVEQTGKQDIEGFKEFVKSNSTETIIKNSADLSKESILDDISNSLTIFKEDKTLSPKEKNSKIKALRELENIVKNKKNLTEKDLGEIRRKFCNIL